MPFQPHPLPVLDAIAGRRSIRRFRPDPVPEAVVRDILHVAARSPSGSNTQPWTVHVVLGAARDRLVRVAEEAAQEGQEPPEYEYLPDTWFEPALSHRRKVGFDLYGLLGLTRENKAGMAAQHQRNLCLFDAPVGLFFSMDRRFALGSWLDMGMFMQSVMLAARGYGLETCPQAAWVWHGQAVRRAIGLDDDHILLCGMSLGIEDTEAVENQLHTERASVDDFATFLSE